MSGEEEVVGVFAAVRAEAVVGVSEAGEAEVGGHAHGDSGSGVMGLKPASRRAGWASIMSLWMATARSQVIWSTRLSMRDARSSVMGKERSPVVCRRPGSAGVVPCDDPSPPPQERKPVALAGGYHKNEPPGGMTLAARGEVLIWAPGRARSDGISLSREGRPGGLWRRLEACPNGTPRLQARRHRRPLGSRSGRPPGAS